MLDRVSYITGYLFKVKPIDVFLSSSILGVMFKVPLHQPVIFKGL